jgi:hypothetical protein
VSGELIANGVEVDYEGPATLGGSGRGRLHDRAGGIGEMLWEALAGAGWVGEVATLRMTVCLRVGVAAALSTGPKQPARFDSLPGGVRQLGETGWVDDQGVAWQQYAGPLNGRAAGPGYLLLESERRPEELEFGEDMFYTAAVRAGWLAGGPDEVVEVPDVRITVSVARRNQTWEAFANAPDSSRDRDRGSGATGSLPDVERHQRAAPRSARLTRASCWRERSKSLPEKETRTPN